MFCCGDQHRLGDAQLRTVLVLVRGALNSPKKQKASFQLLRVVVKRRVLLPEVYDLMEQLFELILSSQHAPVRRTCGEVLVLYMLTYPLGKKRLQGHLDFIVTNLEVRAKS